MWPHFSWVQKVRLSQEAILLWMVELRLHISLESLLHKEPYHCELFIFKALPATLLLAQSRLQSVSPWM